MNHVSALSKTQAAEVARIQALPLGQQQAAAEALLARVWSAGARHSIRCIFNLA